MFLLPGREGLWTLGHSPVSEHVRLTRSVVERGKTPRSLRRVSSVLPLTRRLADTSFIILIVVSFTIVFATMIYDSVHRLVATAIR